MIFLGARGVANAMQNALNTVVGDPLRPPPRLPVVAAAQLRTIVVIGLGLIGTTVLSGLAGGAGHMLSGFAGRRAALVVSLVLNIGVFWLGFRLGTAAEIRWRQLWLGAAISGVIWQVLQTVGGYFVSHQLAHASPLYGTFAIVLGLIAWLYLQAELTLYAVEINVVGHTGCGRAAWRHRRIRSKTAARSSSTPARSAERKCDIVVGVGGEDDRKKTSG